MSDAWKSQPARAAGFTLVEIIIVIALMGLVLSLVLPRMGTAGTVSSASRQLIGMIRALSITASATQKTYRLYLDLDQQAYWAVVVESDGERPPVDASLAQRVSLPAHIQLRDATTLHQGKVVVGRAMIQFYPTGRAERSVIHLSDAAPTTLTLVLNPLTGGVQVSDGYMEPNPVQPVAEQFRPLLLPGMTTNKS